MQTDTSAPRSNDLTYNNHHIARNDQMISLRDLYDAAGSPSGHAPHKWARFPEVIDFIKTINDKTPSNASDDYTPEELLVRHSHYYGYRDIALAYAAHLDPDIHAWLQRALAEEDSRDPELVYEGHPIGCKGDMLSLTSMWMARGKPANRAPFEWSRLPSTKRLIDEFDREYRDQSITGLSRNTLQTNRGNSETAGTWAHKEIALAYAAYLSPSFHLWVLRVALKQMETGGPPADGRARPMGEIFAGELAKLQRSADGLHRRLNQLNANDARIVERIEESDEREDRNAVDIMFLVSSMKDILFGQRMEFSRSSREIIWGVVVHNYGSLCPCCGERPVIRGDGEPVEGAEYDHHLGPPAFPRPGRLACHVAGWKAAQNSERPRPCPPLKKSCAISRPDCMAARRAGRYPKRSP